MSDLISRCELFNKLATVHQDKKRVGGGQNEKPRENGEEGRVPSDGM